MCDVFVHTHSHPKDDLYTMSQGHALSLCYTAFRYMYNHDLIASYSGYEHQLMDWRQDIAQRMVLVLAVRVRGHCRRTAMYHDNIVATNEQLLYMTSDRVWSHVTT